MLKQTCLILFSLNVFVTCLNNPHDDLFPRVLKALGRVLEYIYQNLEDMNVDGLFGVVFTDANLQSLLKQKKLSDEDIIRERRNLALKILKNVDYNKMSLNSKSKVFVNYLLDPNIWNRNISFIRGKITNYTEFSMATNIKTCNDYIDYIKQSYFTEETSDECLLQLITSAVKKIPNCPVGELCNDYMINNKYHFSGYGITHRLLFLQVAEALQCKLNKEWMEQKVKEYCSHIYKETLFNSKCGFLGEFDDLFLEQVFLCGYEGFMEFMTSKWIEHVLSIQTIDGCFGIFFNKQNAYKNELRRKRREANLMKSGCLDHTTGLGAAVLSLFLRFLDISEL